MNKNKLFAYALLCLSVITYNCIASDSDSEEELEVIASGGRPSAAAAEEEAAVIKTPKIPLKGYADDKPFKCTICDKAFKNSSNLIEHIKIHTGEKPFLCEICGKSFSQSSNLAKHIRIHTDEKPYKCAICDKSFRNLGSLKNHKKIHQNQNKAELLCQVEPSSESNDETEDEQPLTPQSNDLTKQMRTKSYECILCGESFAQPSGLKDHFAPTSNCWSQLKRTRAAFKDDSSVAESSGKDASEPPKKIVVIEVPESESSEGELEVVASGGTPEVNNEIIATEPTFSASEEEEPAIKTPEITPFDLREFRKNFEQFPNQTIAPSKECADKPYKRKDLFCKFKTCEYKNEFKSSELLEKHIQEQHGQCKNVCKTCGKEFAYSSLLARHTRTHTGEKPYECTICEQAFAQSNYLTTHLRMHTGEKPFLCGTCGKSFTQSSHLASHMRIHTDEKPYKCAMCDKSFRNLSGLKNHKKIHQNQNKAELLCQVEPPSKSDNNENSEEETETEE